VAYKDYPTVMALSSDREALLAAWNTPITQDDARKLVYDYLDEDELHTLDFTATTMRGAAWNSGKIRLPITPTLGITLHEVAHIIHHGRGHGPDYIKILDGLVQSERLWKAHPYTEEELFQK
jgi:hypothetical protein